MNRLVSIGANGRERITGSATDFDFTARRTFADGEPVQVEDEPTDDAMNDLPARWRRGSPERQAAACMLKRLRGGLDRRVRKIRHLRAAIKVGVYENDLKLHIAMDRLLEDFESLHR